MSRRGKRRSAPGNSRRRSLSTRRTPGLANRVWQRMRQRARERQTMMTLRSLSDATLKDIGVQRSEIPFIAMSGKARDAGRGDR